MIMGVCYEGHCDNYKANGNYVHINVYWVYCISKKITDEKGSRQMANLLVWVINPIVMLISYQMEFSMEKLKQLGISFALSLVSMIIGIIIAEIIFKDNQGIDKFAVSFANGGFIGIPLVTNVLGVENVFFYLLT